MIGWFAPNWHSKPWVIRFVCDVLLFFIGMKIISVTLPFLNAYPIYYLIAWGLFSASLFFAALIINALRYSHWCQCVELVSEKGEALSPAKPPLLDLAAMVLLILVLLAGGSLFADTWSPIGEYGAERPIAERVWLYASLLVITLFAPLALLLLAILVDALLPSARRCARIEFSVSENPEDVLRRSAQLERIPCYDGGFGPPVPDESRDGKTYTVEATSFFTRAIVKSVRIVVQERSPSKVAFLCTAQPKWEACLSLELNGNSLLCQFDVRTGLRLDKLLVRLMGSKTYARFVAVGEAKHIAQCADCEVRILSVTPSC